jgi:hypothetical protein
MEGMLLDEVWLAACHVRPVAVLSRSGVSRL